jgi:hypothetical protein
VSRPAMSSPAPAVPEGKLLSPRAFVLPGLLYSAYGDENQQPSLNLLFEWGRADDAVLW